VYRVSGAECPAVNAPDAANSAAVNLPAAVAGKTEGLRSAGGQIEKLTALAIIKPNLLDQRGHR